MQETYDNYGFKRKKYSIHNQMTLFQTEQEKANYCKWQQILKDLDSYRNDKQREFIQLVRIGIPDMLRPTIWPKLCIKPMKQFEICYAEYKKGGELKEINLDLDRTMPDNIKFLQMREKLKTILNTIAIAFPEMGYCQGLNFIAANLLLILDQKSAFDAMYHILYWQRHQLLIKDLENIHRKTYCLEKLIKKNYPQMHKTMKQCQNNPLVFTTSWFITLFNNILPYKYVFRILECYFLEGDKILYRVALQIFKQKKKIIKQSIMQEDVFQELSNFKQFNSSMIDRFFNEMFQIQLSRKEIQQYQSQYESKKLKK